LLGGKKDREEECATKPGLPCRPHARARGPGDGLPILCPPEAMRAAHKQSSTKRRSAEVPRCRSPAPSGAARRPQSPALVPPAHDPCFPLSTRRQQRQRLCRRVAAHACTSAPAPARAKRRSLLRLHRALPSRAIALSRIQRRCLSTPFQPARSRIAQIRLTKSRRSRSDIAGQTSYICRDNAAFSPAGGCRDPRMGEPRTELVCERRPGNSATPGCILR
jgi:hypothetical protein